jgi:hypothetical protein
VALQDLRLLPTSGPSEIGAIGVVTDSKRPTADESLHENEATLATGLAAIAANRSLSSSTHDTIGRNCR